MRSFRLLALVATLCASLPSSAAELQLIAHGSEVDLYLSGTSGPPLRIPPGVTTDVGQQIAGASRDVIVAQLLPYLTSGAVTEANGRTPAQVVQLIYQLELKSFSFVDGQAYVATTGNDNNPCTLAAPCLTPQRYVTGLIKVRRAQTQLNIAPGTYGCALGTTQTQTCLSIADFFVEPEGPTGEAPYLIISGQLGQQATYGVDGGPQGQGGDAGFWTPTSGGTDALLDHATLTVLWPDAGGPFPTDGGLSGFVEFFPASLADGGSGTCYSSSVALGQMPVLSNTNTTITYPNIAGVTPDTTCNFYIDAPLTTLTDVFTYPDAGTTTASSAVEFSGNVSSSNGSGVVLQYVKVAATNTGVYLDRTKATVGYGVQITSSSGTGLWATGGSTATLSGASVTGSSIGLLADNQAIVIASDAKLSQTVAGAAATKAAVMTRNEGSAQLSLTDLVSAQTCLVSKAGTSAAWATGYGTCAGIGVYALENGFDNLSSVAGTAGFYSDAGAGFVATDNGLVEVDTNTSISSIAFAPDAGTLLPDGGGGFGQVQGSAGGSFSAAALSAATGKVISDTARGGRAILGQ